MKPVPIYAYDPKKNKRIKAGSLLGDVFIKQVTSKHYMRREQGYGIQEEVLEVLKEKGCKYIIIKTKISSYTSKLSQWIGLPVKNYGHGLQRFMRVDKMEITG